jgi:UDP-4-amino-4-deoxy-L-arabinose-oxoglutarate aminotransferase
MTVIPHSRPWITEADVAALAAVLRSHQVGAGALGVELEDTFASWVSAAGGVAVSSGAAALELALRTLGCSTGDEIILPSYVCRDVLEAILNAGAKPVFCDVGPDWLVARSNVITARTPRTRALILPHLYGRFADTASMCDLGMPVIEDFAQAVAACGTVRLIGEIGIFSLHPTKCLTAGEGGMMVARTSGQVERARRWRDGCRGLVDRRQFASLSDLAAALALSQLRRYDDFLTCRNVIAKRYAEAAAHWSDVRQTPPSSPYDMRFRFTFHHPRGLTAFVGKFEQKGITVRRGVDELLHRLCGLPDSSFVQSVAHFNTTLSLPIHPELSEIDVDRVIAAADGIFGKSRA